MVEKCTILHWLLLRHILGDAGKSNKAKLLTQKWQQNGSSSSDNKLKKKELQLQLWVPIPKNSWRAPSSWRNQWDGQIFQSITVKYCPWTRKKNWRDYLYTKLVLKNSPFAFIPHHRQPCTNALENQRLELEKQVLSFFPTTFSSSFLQAEQITRIFSLCEMQQHGQYASRKVITAEVANQSSIHPVTPNSSFL